MIFFSSAKVLSDVDILLPTGFSVICALPWPEYLRDLIQKWVEHVDAITLIPVVESFSEL